MGRIAGRPEISPENTTLIGDYISVALLNSRSWLVQVFGNATFQSTTDKIIEQSLTVDKKYIFLQIGGNQIRSASKHSTFNQLLKTVTAVRQYNHDCKIFVVGVLPRPVENESAKPFIIKFNRWLKSACDRINAFFANVKFIPAQLSFIDSTGPKLQYFNSDDLLTLNELGADLLKRMLFSHAGFVRNI